MKISSLYGQSRPVVSLEVFPPKRTGADIDEIYGALGKISALAPDYISVTYGAGGAGNSNMTAEIASFIEQKGGVCSLAHFTCIGLERERVGSLLDEMHSRKISNVLALRGDIPEGTKHSGSYMYAEDLIREIRARGDFCIGAACYPEGHIDCDDLDFDTRCMKRKQDAGADFFISQLFFDNDYYFRFLERVRKGGITLPISAGVMPILNQKQIERMIFLCGSSLPSGIIKLLHKYKSCPADLTKAGIEFAAAQLEDLLARGADGVHIYTMNKPDIAAHCMKHIGRAK